LVQAELVQVSAHLLRHQDLELFTQLVAVAVHLEAEQERVAQVAVARLVF
jgi:hypothetical protein